MQLLPSSDIIQLLALSLAFRWFVFRYRYSLRFWQWAAAKSPIIHELTHCPYCQTIEASTVLYGLYGWVYGFNWWMPFAILLNGWVAILIEPWVLSRVERLEYLSALSKSAKSAVIQRIIERASLSGLGEEPAYPERSWKTTRIEQELQ